MPIDSVPVTNTEKKLVFLDKILHHNKSILVDFLLFFRCKTRSIAVGKLRNYAFILNFLWFCVFC
jgi:hypothetical protein